MSTTQAPAVAILPAAKGEAPQILQPSGWPMPKGYANGMAADGRLVVTGGVIGWDSQGHLPAGFVAQGAKRNVLELAFREIDANHAAPAPVFFPK